MLSTPPPPPRTHNCCSIPRSQTQLISSPKTLPPARTPLPLSSNLPLNLTPYPTPVKPLPNEHETPTKTLPYAHEIPATPPNDAHKTSSHTHPHSPTLPSPPTRDRPPHTLKDAPPNPPNTRHNVIPSPPSSRYPPTYPPYSDLYLGFSLSNPFFQIHLDKNPAKTKLSSHATNCPPQQLFLYNYSSLNTLTHNVPTLLGILQNPKQTSPISLNTSRHPILCKPSLFLYNILNIFLIYPLHNAPILFSPLYICIPFLLINHPSRNTYEYLPPYLITNTYPKHSPLNHLDTQTISLTFLLLQCGDVELNPGPCFHTNSNLPQEYESRRSIYFIPKTIKIRSEYQHLAKNFAPHLLSTHPLHLQKVLSHPHLSQFIHTHTSYPSPQILYILIVTMSPSPDTCELTLRHSPNPPFVQILFTYLSLLPTQPEAQITIPYPFDLFQHANTDLIHPSNTIHT
jgi:hypothetical protein